MFAELACQQDAPASNLFNFGQISGLDCWDQCQQERWAADPKVQVIFYGNVLRILLNVIMRFDWEKKFKKEYK